MTQYEKVLTEAMQLPVVERLRLIDQLWDSVPEDAEPCLSDEWKCEIERRVEEVKRGTAKTVPWSEVLDRAIARLSHESID